MSNAADPCGWVVDQIPRYLDGELPPDLAGRVAGHLAACGACRMRKSDEEQRIADVIHALVAEEPPEDLPARVVERIAAQAAPHRRTSLRLRLPAAAAVILAALVGFWALERRGAPGDRTASPGAEEMINEEIADGAAEGGQPSPGQSDDPVDRDGVRGAPAVARGGAVMPPTASGPSAGFLEGDLDGNGSFELADLRSLLDYLGRGTRAPACLAAADLDGDGRITPGDSVIIAMRLSEEGAETIGGRPLIAHHRALGLPCETACP